MVQVLVIWATLAQSLGGAAHASALPSMATEPAWVGAIILSVLTVAIIVLVLVAMAAGFVSTAFQLAELRLARQAQRRWTRVETDLADLRSEVGELRDEVRDAKQTFDRHHAEIMRVLDPNGITRAR